MNYNRKINKLAIIGAVGFLAVTSLSNPMESRAAGTVAINDIMPTAGGIFDLKLDEDSCLKAAEATTEGMYWGYNHLGIADVETGNLNVRAIPATDGKLVGKMPKGSACEVVEMNEDGTWAHIKSGDVDGYVSTDYLYTGADAGMRAMELVKTVAVVNADALKVREQAGMDATVLTSVPKGEELEVVEQLDGWVKVSIDGEDAYVSSEYVTVEEKLDTAVTMSELLYGQGVSNLRVDIVEYAKQFLGNKYVYGGSSLTKGTDCSGFTMSVYKHFGISLSHSSRAQANEGKKITAADLQPGDLIFYGGSSGSINHVAMYIGGGKVIHASSPKTGIKISNYTYRTPVKYVSIIRD